MKGGGKGKENSGQNWAIFSERKSINLYFPREGKRKKSRDLPIAKTTNWKIDYIISSRVGKEGERVFWGVKPSLGEGKSYPRRREKRGGPLLFIPIHVGAISVYRGGGGKPPTR